MFTALLLERVYGMLDRLTIIIRTCKPRKKRAELLAKFLYKNYTQDIRVLMCATDLHYSEDFLFKLSRCAAVVQDFVLVLEDDMILSKQAYEFVKYLIQKSFPFVWCTLESPHVFNHSLGQDAFGLNLVRSDVLAYSGAVFYSRETLQFLCEHSLLTHLDNNPWKYDLQFSALASQRFGGVLWCSGEHFATDLGVESCLDRIAALSEHRNKSTTNDFGFDFTQAVNLDS